MPKIIENLQDKIIETTKKQLLEKGYKSTTIRSIANECGIGVGTLYNYFKSKNYIISSFMLKDWSLCKEQFKAAEIELKEGKIDKKCFFRKNYSSLLEFNSKYAFLFNDSDAKVVFSSVLSEKHTLIVKSISENLKVACLDSQISDIDFLAEHIANLLLTWSVSNIPFETGYEIIEKLL
jgi:AcrR family transcriptional regulator